MTHEKTELMIAPCDYRAAKYAVMKWHYSRTMPVGKLVKYGVWENDIFSGCVIFGRGASKPIYKSLSLGYTELVELVRVALNKHATPVSKIISICIKILKRTNPGLKMIVSFSDMNQNHYGTIYQAGNWIYTGETARMKVPVIDGKMVHKRTLGVTHFDDNLKTMPNRSYREKVKRKKIQKEKAVMVLIKPKHRYLYPLCKSAKVYAETKRLPYPKCPTGETVSRPAVQPGIGGSIPTVGLNGTKTKRSAATRRPVGRRGRTGAD